MLTREIQALLQSWKAHMATAALVFIHAPSANAAPIFSTEPKVLDRHDGRIRSVPFSTRRPTFSEAQRVMRTLLTVYSVERTAVPEPAAQQQEAVAEAARCAAAVQGSMARSIDAASALWVLLHWGVLGLRSAAQKCCVAFGYGQVTLHVLDHKGSGESRLCSREPDAIECLLAVSQKKHLPPSSSPCQWQSLHLSQPSLKPLPSQTPSCIQLQRKAMLPGAPLTAWLCISHSNAARLVSFLSASGPQSLSLSMDLSE